jgi:tetratricopeptide (TPR) repeat protein
MCYSTVCLLQATKLDPQCFSCYVYLGHYYSLSAKDLDKARRCYQKAFRLNPHCKEAGAALSDIYRLQKNPVSTIIAVPLHILYHIAISSFVSYFWCILAFISKNFKISWLIFMNLGMNVIPL